CQGAQSRDRSATACNPFANSTTIVRRARRIIPKPSEMDIAARAVAVVGPVSWREVVMRHSLVGMLVAGAALICGTALGQPAAAEEKPIRILRRGPTDAQQRPS